MSSRRLFALALVLSFHLIVTAIAVGQTDTAAVTGLITDSLGKVVPGAEVVVTNEDTGVSVHQTTNEAGLYVVSGLKPGRYRVSFSKEGFRRVDLTDVVLNVQDVLSRNLQLQLGSVESSITVAADAATINTTDGSVGTVVDRQFVANIPLNGRSLQALIQLTPGVVLTNVGAGTATGGGQFSVNGQRTTSNYYMVDGVSANTGIIVTNSLLPGDAGAGQTPGTSALGGTNSLVSLDALQEFRIETSSYAAEFGRTPGGQISLVTRGGTNQFHGSASEYFRNEAMDANDWFANANSLAKPKERQNLFGGVLGGPIKKDRIFFFASYEGLRLQQPQVQLVSEPTVATRTQAVPGLLPYLNALPLPNGQVFSDGTAQFAASYSNPGTFNVFSLRLDGKLTDRLTSFFRISHAPSESGTRGRSLSTVISTSIVNDSYTGGLTWIAGSRLTADVRLNWTRNVGRFFQDLDAFAGAIVPQPSDIFLQPGRDPSNASFSFAFLPGGDFRWGLGSSDTQRQFNSVGAVTWLVGSHQLKLGVDYRRMLPLIGGVARSFETLLFSSAADLQSGTALQYVVSVSDVQRKAVIPDLSLFAQDTWRVNNRLTLTYGLRFERVPPPSETTGHLPRTLLGIENDLLQNPRLAPQGTPLFRKPAVGVAPRFGGAYRLGGRQGWEATLRGGAGLFYDLPLGIIANAFDDSRYPYSASRTVRNVLFPLSASDRTPPVLGVDPPAALSLLDPNILLPYTAQWNASWEQGVGQAQTLTVTYVGAAGRRLLTLQTYQQQLADFPNTTVSLSIQRNLSTSNYRAVQVQYQRRLHRGVQALASYTFGRSRDNQSLGSGIAPPASQPQLLAQQYGPSDFDVRHVFSGALTYDLPKLSGAAPIKAVLSGSGLDLLIRFQSAFPFSPLARNTMIVDNVLFQGRPDLVPGQPLYINDLSVPGRSRWNRAAFTTPAAGQQGNFPRNGLRGFPASQVDLALRREFKLSENVRLQLRGEFFNLLNHPNFGPPETSIINGNFGKPTQMLNNSLGGLNGLYQMGGPRSGQLAIKLVW